VAERQSYLAAHPAHAKRLRKLGLIPAAGVRRKKKKGSGFGKKVRKFVDGANKVAAAYNKAQYGI